jgi:UDP-glucose:(heptosyl)LPS alpha-1,3-glucosyltransferase
VGSVLSRVYPPHVTSLAWERRCFGSGSTPIIALTRRVKAELESHLAVDPRRIHVIPNGVDTRHFRPPASRAQARHEVRHLTGPVPEEALVLLFAGYEFGRKGLARAIEAIPRAGDERIRLWVAGGDEPAPYLRLAERLGVADRVRFLGHQAEMRPLFQAADAFVLPSSYEALALVLLEALACGTPLITSQVAGVADFVTEGREAFLLARPEDPAELAATLRRFAALADGRGTMAEAARSLAEHLDWDVIWRRTRGLYEEVLAAKSASSRAGS